MLSSFDTQLQIEDLTAEYDAYLAEFRAITGEDVDLWYELYYSE